MWSCAFMNQEHSVHDQNSKVNNGEYKTITVDGKISLAFGVQTERLSVK